eukprot:1160573-Pelagomonas_calceolata.AAC.6
MHQRCTCGPLPQFPPQATQLQSSTNGRVTSNHRTSHTAAALHAPPLLSSPVPVWCCAAHAHRWPVPALGSAALPPAAQ